MNKNKQFLCCIDTLCINSHWNLLFPIYNFILNYMKKINMKKIDIRCFLLIISNAI